MSTAQTSLKTMQPKVKVVRLTGLHPPVILSIPVSSKTTLFTVVECTWEEIPKTVQFPMRFSNITLQLKTVVLSTGTHPKVIFQTQNSQETWLIMVQLYVGKPELSVVSVQVTDSYPIMHA